MGRGITSSACLFSAGPAAIIFVSSLSIVVFFGHKSKPRCSLLGSDMWPKPWPAFKSVCTTLISNIKHSQTQLQEQNSGLLADVVSVSLNNDPETLIGRLDAYVPFYGHGEDADEMVVIYIFNNM